MCVYLTVVGLTIILGNPSKLDARAKLRWTLCVRLSHGQAITLAQNGITRIQQNDQSEGYNNRSAQLVQQISGPVDQVTAVVGSHEALVSSMDGVLSKLDQLVGIVDVLTEVWSTNIL